MYAEHRDFQEDTTTIFVHFYLPQRQATTFLGFLLLFCGFDYALKRD
jgi:hypothetical protein